MDADPHGIGTRLLTRTITGSVTVAMCALLATLGSASAAGASGESSAAGAFWPIDPHPISRPFDPPACAYCAGHRGVDLGTFPLAPVRAAFSGTVTYAGPLAGRGVLVIDDQRRRMTYEPVAATVHAGTHVSPGDPVAQMELVGSHCYPDACLHLGLIDDLTEEYLDPLSLFGQARGPVRLLPLRVDQPIGLSRLLFPM